MGFLRLASTANCPSFKTRRGRDEVKTMSKHLKSSQDASEKSNMFDPQNSLTNRSRRAKDTLSRCLETVLRSLHTAKTRSRRAKVAFHLHWHNVFEKHVFLTSVVSWRAFIQWRFNADCANIKNESPTNSQGASYNNTRDARHDTTLRAGCLASNTHHANICVLCCTHMVN